MHQTATQDYSDNKTTTKPSNSTVRLRSACDACHEAKTRCSGGNPCVSCHVSMSTCVYSRGSRLGRPKGSKNKRTGQAKDNCIRERKKTQANTTDDALESTKQTEATIPALDFERALNTTFGSFDPLDSLMSPVMDSMDPNQLTHLFPSDGDDSFQSLFSQTLNPTSIAPPWYSYGGSTPPSSAGNDSAYATSIGSPINFSSGHNLVHAGIDTSTCTCLQQQARLVYQLGDLQNFHAQDPSVDRVLHHVEVAQKPWQNLMQCSHGTEHEKEIFLLFAASIRILLSSVQRLQGDSAKGGGLRDLSSEPPHIGVLVGNFELTGEAKREVIAVVKRRVLRIISSALLHLHSRTGAGGDGAESPSSAITNLSNKLLKQQDQSSPFLFEQEIRDSETNGKVL